MGRMVEPTKSNNAYDFDSEKQRIVYFNFPTQVKFYYCDDDSESTWLGGIGYRDCVICGECGYDEPLEDIYENAQFNGLKEAPIKVLPWIDISDCILEAED